MENIWTLKNHNFKQFERRRHIRKNFSSKIKSPNYMTYFYVKNRAHTFYNLTCKKERLGYQSIAHFSTSR